MPRDLLRFSPTLRLRALPPLLGLLLAGCAVGPDYHRPDAPPVGRSMSVAAAIRFAVQ